MADSRRLLFIMSEPGNRTNSSRNEQKAVRQFTADAGQKFCQLGHKGHAGEIIIAERRVAGVAGEQHFLAALAGEEIFPVSKRAIFEAGVDAHFVVAVREFQQFMVTARQKPQFSL